MRDRTITEQIFEQRTQAKRVAEAVGRRAGSGGAPGRARSRSSPNCKAPVTGRIGDRRVSPGNLVTGGTGGNTTLLATIVSIDPIRFEFTFDEASLLRYERLGAGRQGRRPAAASAPVRLKLIDEPDFAHDGRMDFVDNVIDRATGTIRGRAQFANPNGLFTPGMFGRVQVPGSAPYEALLVPDVRSAPSRSRKFVLVVDTENIARQKYVTLGQRRRRFARHQGRAVGRRPRHRQRPDAGAPGRKGRRRREQAPPPAAAPQAETN